MSDNDDLREQMAKFAAARVTAPVELHLPELGKVVAVHDGTDQDRTVDQLAAEIARRCAIPCQTLPLDPTARDVLPEMLAAAGERDVIVVPSPFGRDYEQLGQLSLSTAIDLLLAKSDASVCIARAPIDDVEHALSHPMVGLQIDRHRKVSATAMALALARGGGELLLLSTVDPHRGLREEELLARNLDPHDVSPEALSGLASARAAALTSALQRHASEWDVEPLVHFAIGDTVDLMLAENERRRGILVVGRDRDPRHEDAQSARRLVLGSALPVLLV